ncbi:MAG: hypothetical protein L0Y70_10750 [Gemmataceae bacterium]|nr:hypothetical protein [Gemmataceae bacterium]
MNEAHRRIVSHSFHGGRFEDHGVELDVLLELIRYQTLLVELAKELWRRYHPGRERLPKNFEDSLGLKFYEVARNCATIPLVRALAPHEESQFPGFQGDELDEAVELVAMTIDAAANNQALPDEFPKHLLALFEDYGNTLREDEWIEQQPAQAAAPSRYDAVVRARLTEWLSPSYQAFVDVAGPVTMARVSKPRMALQLGAGQEVEAAFRPQDEDLITTALKQHATAKLRVIGRGQFGQDGRLQKIVEVERVVLLPEGGIPFDAAAKPIWEEFADVLATVPPEEFGKLPTDAAQRHDEYLHGPSREGV